MEPALSRSAHYSVSLSMAIQYSHAFPDFWLGHHLCVTTVELARRAAGGGGPLAGAAAAGAARALLR